MKQVLTSILLTLGIAVSATGSTLLLDFGPTAPTGSTTNSPFHTATGSTLSNWNVVGTADSSSLFYADNTAATGLSLNLGASAVDSTLISLANQPDSSNALGSVVNTGVYAGNSVGTDGIFESTGSNVASVGFQLSGLAAGLYDVYVNTRNTNTSVVYSMATFVAAASAGDFDHAAYSSRTLTYPNGATGATASWVEEGNAGENYTKFTVNIATGQVLNLAVAGGGTQTRGFLNSAAIVSVPEPGSIALFGVGLAFLGVRARKRA